MLEISSFMPSLASASITKLTMRLSENHSELDELETRQKDDEGHRSLFLDTVEFVEQTNAVTVIPFIH